MTSILLSTPPLRITPTLACRERDWETAMPPEAEDRLTGLTGRDRGAAMNGLLASPACVARLEFLLGVLTNAMLFIPAKKDGVKGVFASERERPREGVLAF